jgi:hypothetical protein
LRVSDRDDSEREGIESDRDRVDVEFLGFGSSVSDGEGSVSEGRDNVASDSLAPTACALVGSADSSWFVAGFLAVPVACFRTEEFLDFRDVPTASRFSVFGLAM